MKWKFNIVKTIVTPIELEAENFVEALSKAQTLASEVDTDHGTVNYTIDTKPSDSQIKWADH